MNIDEIGYNIDMYLHAHIKQLEKTMSATEFTNNIVGGIATQNGYRAGCHGFHNIPNREALVKYVFDNQLMVVDGNPVKRRDIVSTFHNKILPRNGMSTMGIEYYWVFTQGDIMSRRISFPTYKDYRPSRHKYKNIASSTVKNLDKDKLLKDEISMLDKNRSIINLSQMFMRCLTPQNVVSHDEIFGWSEKIYNNIGDIFEHLDNHLLIDRF